jgi:hypothetical protein
MGLRRLAVKAVLIKLLLINRPGAGLGPIPSHYWPDEWPQVNRESIIVSRRFRAADIEGEGRLLPCSYHWWLELEARYLVLMEGCISLRKVRKHADSLPAITVKLGGTYTGWVNHKMALRFPAAIHVAHGCVRLPKR